MKNFEVLSEAETHNDSISEPQKVIFNKIWLKEGVYPIHYYTYLYHSLSVLLILVPVETLNVMLLGGKDYLNLVQDQIGKTIANFILLETILRVSCSPLLGVMNDRYGRRKVLIISYIIGSIGIFCMARVHTVYPGYIFCRLCHSIFITSGFSVPLTGDYIRPETQGKAAGVRFLFTAIGALSSSLLVKLMLNIFEIYTILTFISLYTILSGIICYTFLKKDDNIHNNNNSIQLSMQNDNNNNNNNKFRVYMEYTLVLLKENPWLIIGLSVSFLARCEGYLVTTYIILWTQTFYPTDSDSQKLANQKATTYSTLVYTIFSLFTILFGIFYDKFNKKFLLLLTYSSISLACILFICTNNPFNILTTISMLLLGVGLAGLMITSYFLLNVYTNDESRGLLMGVSIMLGSLGQFFISFLGSYFFTIISKIFPMLMFLFVLAASALINFIVLKFKISQ